MSSPFPGMDPYLEGRLWPDLQISLAVAIANRLGELIPAQYSIRTHSTFIDSDEPALSLGMLRRLDHERRERGLEAAIRPRLTVPAPVPARVKAYSVRITVGGTDKLVTSIEILPPGRKSGDAFHVFRRRWLQLHRQGVHLVEIDLVRRGRRIFTAAELVESPYLITVTRGSSLTTDAWPFTFREPIPAFPVPLLAPDPDAPVDLQAIFERIYTVARYANDVDYSVPPPPPALSPEDDAWARELIAAATASAT